jgi:predicted RNA polymerase sigma factor
MPRALPISPTTMGQRLVRAKTKIRDGGIRFEIPQESELAQRLEAVLEAIYSAFGIGWDDMAGVDQRGRDLAEEAIWLARVLLQLKPREAEVHGLLALMLHCEARRAARRGPDGRCVPLSEQDCQKWSLPLIEEAERHLDEASSRGHSGRFQLEGCDSVGTRRAGAERRDSVECDHDVLWTADPDIADGRHSPEGYPQTAPYKWWNWHDNYDAEALPDRKWVEVSDAGEAAFRKRDAEPKAS